MFSSRLARLLLSALLLSNFPAQARAQSATAASFNFDFRNGAQGWQAGFADYPPSTDLGPAPAGYGLEADVRNLPPEIAGGGTGFYIQGNNHSDDLFMFLKRRLDASDGIVAGQAYEVTYTVVMASNASKDCGGIGGSPGLGVFLKTGASPAEPLALLNSEPRFPSLRMNVDKGNQAVGGIAASVAGNIATDQPCTGSSPYVSIVRTHKHTSPVLANSRGELWLLVGTDSGFEGLTSLYYQRIQVSLQPLAAPPAPVLLTDSATGRAAALDSVMLTADPFAVVNPSNLIAPDHRTRLALFAYNMELRAAEDPSAVITAQAQDAQQQTHALAVESVGTLPDFGWITQVVVRLPDSLANSTEARVTLRLRGVATNQALVRLKP